MQNQVQEQERELSELRQNHQILTNNLNMAIQEKNQTQREADKHKDITKQLKLDNQALVEIVEKMKHILSDKDEKNEKLSSRLVQAENHVKLLKNKSDELEKIHRRN